MSGVVRAAFWQHSGCVQASFGRRQASLWRRSGNVWVALGRRSGVARRRSGYVLATFGLHVGVVRATTDVVLAKFWQRSGCAQMSFGRRQLLFGQSFCNVRVASRRRSGGVIATLELRVCVVRATLAVVRAKFWQHAACVEASFGRRKTSLGRRSDNVWVAFWHRSGDVRRRLGGVLATFGLREMSFGATRRQRLGCV